MNVYNCPKCQHHSMMWDARCSCFLCTHPQCGASIKIEDAAEAQAITLGQKKVSQTSLRQRWLLMPHEAR
ncbi:MAG: hypothetical protein ABFC88_12540 [Thermoguttaceae bacterium]